MSENTKPDGGLAFPHKETFADETLNTHHFSPTLRDYFAAKAMQAMLSNPVYFVELQDSAVENNKLGHPTTVYWLVASLSQDMADEMIAARNRRSKP